MRAGTCMPQSLFAVSGRCVAFSTQTHKEQCRAVSSMEKENWVGSHRTRRSKTHGMFKDREEQKSG